MLNIIMIFDGSRHSMRSKAKIEGEYIKILWFYHYHARHVPTSMRVFVLLFSPQARIFIPHNNRHDC